MHVFKTLDGKFDASYRITMHLDPHRTGLTADGGRPDADPGSLFEVADT
jgi:hypothetical protein